MTALAAIAARDAHPSGWRILRGVALGSGAAAGPYSFAVPTLVIALGLALSLGAIVYATAGSPRLIFRIARRSTLVFLVFRHSGSRATQRARQEQCHQGIRKRLVTIVRSPSCEGTAFVGRTRSSGSDEGGTPYHRCSTVPSSAPTTLPNSSISAPPWGTV